MSTPGGAYGIEEVAAVADAVGVRPELVLWYEDFAAGPPVAEIAMVAAAQLTPVLTWEPRRWRTDVADGDAIMPGIAAGRHDEYLGAWADALAEVHTPLYLRFAHEFNGHWYPWSPAGGATPADYVAAWRHVHDLFGRRGATAVRWIWSPDAGRHTEHPLADWYPGDDYVDVVGIDGYNWGTTLQWSAWASPGEIFEATVTQVRALTGKPMMIAEVGCAGEGGDKAHWIGEFVDWVSAQDDIDAFIWFEHDKETDWRVAGTPRYAAAMANALREARR
ncbi:glycoside hydrolase family 26 protein [Mycobacterium sp. PS03-16]|uniref:glycoside hydrolase family 26 protein n=1 Tax=Mycobacterium sp. PS03-16 TaxID=2559611 RepID=UPI001FD73135|nr:glycosyl hydrolase [Mycobacterium sp. PS03-16]